MAERLALHLEAGTILVSKDEYYVGHASDGKEVTLGSRGDELTIERYLTENPTPNHWQGVDYA